MFYTYVLQCADTEKGRIIFYVGTSENLAARVQSHKTKSVNTTKAFDAITLVYYEACLHKTDAIIREKQLKTGFGRGYIKRRLTCYLNKRA